MPELDPVVGHLRERWDPVATLGALAHVTILFPFAPPDRIDADRLARVAAIVHRSPARPTTFRRVESFPDHVLYLAPEPADGFRSLTHALADAFPEYPPYRGQFPDVVPHLTVAHDPAAPHEEIRVELAAMLPLTVVTDHVELWVEGTDDRWTTAETFPLSAART
jgi:2'-5' RNA ligase